MPVNKNALLRYRILDRCFSDRHHYYDIEDLVNKVNETFLDMYGKTVSFRQIRADLSYMKDRVSFDAPIEAVPYDGKKCYYRYSDPDFSIFNSDLSNEEVVKLRSTIEMLGRFRGIPGNAWLEEVISNLEYRFGVKANKGDYVAFDQNEQLKGLEHLSTIIDATVNHQPLLIEYRSYKGNEKIITIHPYHVKEFNNRWFLFGLEQSAHSDRIANRALDRIVKISLSDASFIPNTTINFKTYFDDVIGVTVPENTEVEHIVLKFEKDRFPYIVSKPIHHSQKVLSEDECVLQIDVRLNNELYSRIFSFFPQVEVLQPTWLREDFQKKISENLKKYLSVQKDYTEGSELCSEN